MESRTGWRLVALTAAAVVVVALLPLVMPVARPPAVEAPGLDTGTGTPPPPPPPIADPTSPPKPQPPSSPGVGRSGAEPGGTAGGVAPPPIVPPVATARGPLTPSGLVIGRPRPDDPARAPVRPDVAEPSVPRASVRDRFAEVDEALAELVSGHVAFTTPERLRFRESRTVTLIASPAMDATTLAEELRTRIGGNDPVAVEAVQIAPLMEAHLEGAPAFAVTPLTPARQAVSRAAPTEWRWSVLANATGVHTLHLTINAIVTVGGERFPRSLNVLDRQIEVEITAMQRAALFVEANWQWLAGTIVVPFAVWLWTSRRRSGDATH